MVLTPRHRFLTLGIALSVAILFNMVPASRFRGEVVTPVCGNKVIDRWEQCDDGGVCDAGANVGKTCAVDSKTDCPGGTCKPQSNDGCSATCQFELCGDQIVQSKVPPDTRLRNMRGGIVEKAKCTQQYGLPDPLRFCCNTQCDQGTYAYSWMNSPKDCPYLNCTDRPVQSTGTSTCQLPAIPTDIPEGEYLTFDSNYEYSYGDFQKRGMRCYSIAQKKFVQCKYLSFVAGQTLPAAVNCSVSEQVVGSANKIIVTNATLKKTIEIPLPAGVTVYTRFVWSSVNPACTHVLTNVLPTQGVAHEGTIIRYALNWTAGTATPLTIATNVPPQGSANAELMMDPSNPDRIVYTYKEPHGSRVHLWVNGNDQVITPVASSTAFVAIEHLTYAFRQATKGVFAPTGAACERDDQCDAASVCRGGICTAGCCSNVDCIGSCNAGRECIVRGCSTDADCPGGVCEVISDGINRCRTEYIGARPTCVGTLCPTDKKVSCWSDSQCSEGICSSGYCDPMQCKTNANCASGKCSNGACETACQQDEDCDNGYCLKGLCKAFCRSDRNCPSGSICLQKVCVQNACRTDADCTNGRCNELGQCELECNPNHAFAQTASPSAPLQASVMRILCGDGTCAFPETVATCPQDCVESACKPWETCEKGRCQPECVVDKNCPDTTVCVNGRCTKKDTGEECDGGADCSMSCQKIVCGNGRLEQGEECGEDGKYCSGTNVQCQNCRCMFIEPAVCGNGLLEKNEQCERGRRCSGAPAAVMCDESQCRCIDRPVVCEDGYAQAGEQCGEPGLTCATGMTCVGCQCVAASNTPLSPADTSAACCVYAQNALSQTKSRIISPFGSSDCQGSIAYGLQMQSLLSGAGGVARWGNVGLQCGDILPSSSLQEGDTIQVTTSLVPNTPQGALCPDDYVVVSVASTVTEPTAPFFSEMRTLTVTCQKLRSDRKFRPTTEGGAGVLRMVTSENSEASQLIFECPRFVDATPVDFAMIGFSYTTKTTSKGSLSGEGMTPSPTVNILEVVPDKVYCRELVSCGTEYCGGGTDQTSGGGTKAAAVCGNLVADPGEECGEPGLACVAGQQCDTLCHCTSEASAPPPSTPVCGNGTKEGSEQCDAGVACSDSSLQCDLGTCRCVAKAAGAPPVINNLFTPVCGNSVLENGEACGELGAPQCAAGLICRNCQCSKCGNYFLDPTEECEFGIKCETGKKCNLATCQCG